MVMELENSIRSSKHSESDPLVLAESRSSDSSEPYQELRVRIESSEHFEINRALIDVSPSCSEGNQRLPRIDLAFSSSTSSTDDSLLQLRPERTVSPDKYKNFLIKPLEDLRSKSKDSPYNECSTSTSPVSDITHDSQDSQLQGMSPMQSPPMQVMERSGGHEYDPYQIPPTIFDQSNPTTPLEWSTASNESLFSIHVGNNSFSRDHRILFGDKFRSGELTKSGDLNVNKFSSRPLISIPCSEKLHPESVAIGDQKKVVETEKSEATTKMFSVQTETNKVAMTGRATEHKTQQHKSLDSAPNRDNKYRLFRPEKKRKCAWPLCNCCDCKLPSCCYFRWPSCNCCFSCPSCRFSCPSCRHPRCSWLCCSPSSCNAKRCCLCCQSCSNSGNVVQCCSRKAAFGCSWFSCISCHRRSCSGCRHPCSCCHCCS